MAETAASGLKAWLRLNSHPEVGPVRFHRLVEAFGSPENALGKNARAWAALDLARWTPASMEKARREMDRFDVEHDIELTREQGVRVLRYLDEGYPAPLLKTESPPPLLYLRGQWLEQDAQAVAVVGTRKVSEYGREQTARFAGGLAKAGLTIVSGLAHGVDTLAHEAALQAGGRTLAVMGRGLAEIYPLQNSALAEQVAAKGALISQFPMDMQARPYTFPIRNRVVAGLTKGVLVVEGEERSGSLITAHAAADLGRDVFAVPGPVNSALSRGPHRLIQQGARLCTEPVDLVLELSDLPASIREWVEMEMRRRDKQANEEPEVLGAPLPALTGEELKLYELVKKNGDVSSEELADMSGLAAGPLAGVMTMLEIKGAIRSRPGNRFEAVARPAASARG